MDIQETPAVFLSELLGKLYIQENRFPELDAMIRHGILEESLTLAKSLTKHQKSFHTGIDMLKRLDEKEEVVSIFLENDMVFICINTRYYML